MVLVKAGWRRPIFRYLTIIFLFLLTWQIAGRTGQANASPNKSNLTPENALLASGDSPCGDTGALAGCRNIQIILLIDNSSSMLFNDASRSRFKGVENVLDILAKEYYLPAVLANAKDPKVTLPKIDVAIVNFSSDVRYNSGWFSIAPESDADWAQQLARIGQEISRPLDYRQTQTTDFLPPFQAAADLINMAGAQVQGCPHRVVMLFTDGVPHIGRFDLKGSALNDYMGRLEPLIQNQIIARGTRVYVTAFEEATSNARFWTSDYRMEWEKIAGDTLDMVPRLVLYVPTSELPARMDEIITNSIGTASERVRANQLDLLPYVHSLRLTYYAPEIVSQPGRYASFTLTGPQGETILPNGTSVTLTGAGTQVQVLELVNPLPGRYAVQTESGGGIFTQLVRFEQITGSFVAPANPWVQFTHADISMTLLDSEAQRLQLIDTPAYRLSVEASIQQGETATPLALSYNGDAFSAQWLPLGAGHTSINVKGSLMDASGQKICQLFSEPAGEVQVDPVSVAVTLPAQNICTTPDRPLTIPLQVINARTLEKTAISVPIRWETGLVGPAGEDTQAGQVRALDAGQGSYELSFLPSSKTDVDSAITASVVVAGNDAPFFHENIPLAGRLIPTQRLSLELGTPAVLADPVTIQLNKRLQPEAMRRPGTILVGRRLFGLLGRDQVQVTANFVDTANNQDTPGIERFSVKLVNLDTGLSSQSSNAWQPVAGGGYILTLPAPGSGYYRVEVTDQGQPAACVVMSDLPSQNVLLVSGVGEYMSSLLLILSITLLFAWLTVWQLPRFFPRSVKPSNGSTPDPLEHGTTSPENPQKEDEKKEDKKEEKKDKKKAKKEKGYPIEAIEGIGVVYGRRLKRLGIYSTLDLLNKASSAVGREELAAQSKVSTRKILEWVNRADLMRVPGIGEEYSDLLGMAGVKSALALRLSVPIILLDRMREINNEKKLVRRLPSLDDVTAWVVAAVEMESRVVD